jgi:AcrR family transcriptional regulator
VASDTPPVEVEVDDEARPAQDELTTKGAQTRRSILDAAIERFGRDGYRSTSVADIARAAGVSGSLTYAYFPNKEALFLAAADEDAAGVISEGLSSLLEEPESADWRETLIITLLAAVDHHPLARRLLAGLEPEVTARVLGVPALEELRKVIADRLRNEQLRGAVREDIDPTSLANGLVLIVLSLLMSLVQVGPELTEVYATDVAAVFSAAIDPLPAGTLADGLVPDADIAD